jgi:hypothetical protein
MIAGKAIVAAAVLPENGAMRSQPAEAKVHTGRQALSVKFEAVNSPAAVCFED